MYIYMYMYVMKSVGIFIFFSSRLVADDSYVLEMQFTGC
jgi:hypothetical protein